MLFGRSNVEEPVWEGGREGGGAYGVEERCIQGFSGRTLGGKTTEKPSIRWNCYNKIDL
jgi:hypothetical protein